MPIARRVYPWFDDRYEPQILTGLRAVYRLQSDKAKQLLLDMCNSPFRSCFEPYIETLSTQIIDRDRYLRSLERRYPSGIPFPHGSDATRAAGKRTDDEFSATEAQDRNRIDSVAEPGLSQRPSTGSADTQNLLLGQPPSQPANFIPYTSIAPDPSLHSGLGMSDPQPPVPSQEDSQPATHSSISMDPSLVADWGNLTNDSSLPFDSDVPINNDSENFLIGNSPFDNLDFTSSAGKLSAPDPAPHGDLVDYNPSLPPSLPSYVDPKTLSDPSPALDYPYVVQNDNHGNVDTAGPPALPTIEPSMYNDPTLAPSPLLGNNDVRAPPSDAVEAHNQRSMSEEIRAAEEDFDRRAR